MIIMYEDSGGFQLPFSELAESANFLRVQSQSADHKSANLLGKKAVFLIQIRIGLPLILF
jgi:hypothetical protein